MPMNEVPARRWRYAGMAILGVAIFGYATGVLMAPHAPVIGDRLPQLTCLQLAFTAERAAAVLGAFSEQERAAIAGLLIPGDVVFAWGYGFLLVGLLGLLTSRLPQNWQRAGWYLMWAPLVASVLDCIEDVFLHQQALAGPVADPGLAPLLAGIAATLKYAMLSGVAPAYGIAGTIRGIGVDRHPGAWVTYVLVVLTCLSMVAKPLREVPACF
jgi:hypothetical protein